MRDLTDKELNLIAGGNTVSNAASIGGAVGGAAGASYALSIGGSGGAVAGMAGIGAAVVGGVAAAGAAGYAFGVWLNENTPIQQVISNMLPEPRGFNSMMS